MVGVMGEIIILRWVGIDIDNVVYVDDLIIWLVSGGGSKILRVKRYGLLYGGKFYIWCIRIDVCIFCCYIYVYFRVVVVWIRIKINGVCSWFMF